MQEPQLPTRLIQPKLLSIIQEGKMQTEPINILEVVALAKMLVDVKPVSFDGKGGARIKFND